MWCKNVEYSLERFIFVGPKPMPEKESTKLCEQYGNIKITFLPEVFATRTLGSPDF